MNRDPYYYDIMTWGSCYPGSELFSCGHCSMCMVEVSQQRQRAHARSHWFAYRMDLLALHSLLQINGIDHGTAYDELTRCLHVKQIFGVNPDDFVEITNFWKKSCPKEDLE